MPLLAFTAVERQCNDNPEACTALGASAGTSSCGAEVRPRQPGTAGLRSRPHLHGLPSNNLDGDVVSYGGHLLEEDDVQVRAVIVLLSTATSKQASCSLARHLLASIIPRQCVMRAVGKRVTGVMDFKACPGLDIHAR